MSDNNRKRVAEADGNEDCGKSPRPGNSKRLDANALLPDVSSMSRQDHLGDRRPRVPWLVIDPLVRRMPAQNNDANGDNNDIEFLCERRHEDKQNHDEEGENEAEIEQGNGEENVNGNNEADENEEDEYDEDEQENDEEEREESMEPYEGDTEEDNENEMEEEDSQINQECRDEESNEVQNDGQSQTNEENLRGEATGMVRGQSSRLATSRQQYGRANLKGMPAQRPTESGSSPVPLSPWRQMEKKLRKVDPYTYYKNNTEVREIPLLVEQGIDPGVDQNEAGGAEEQPQGGNPVWARKTPEDYQEPFLDCNMILIGTCSCCPGGSYRFYVQESVIAMASLPIWNVIEKIRKTGTRNMINYNIGTYSCLAVRHALDVIYHQATERAMAESSLEEIYSFAENFEMNPVMAWVKKLLTSGTYSKVFFLEFALHYEWMDQIERLFGDASAAERDKALQNLTEKKVPPPKQTWKMLSKILNFKMSSTSGKDPLLRPPS